MVTSAAGEVFGVGRFRDTVDFDPGPAVVQAVAVGGDDGFMIKLDSNGD